MHLVTLSTQEYAARVLPLTAQLWASGRKYETYVADVVEIAESAYGRRFYRTVALMHDDRIVASCKRYERNIRLGNRSLHGVGIGAVFTPPEHRGSGYASAMLAMLLDEARQSADDIAYLYSDIHPAFYKALGFIELPSRQISLRADSLATERITAEPLTETDWPGVRRCFEYVESRRGWGFERSVLVWNWIRIRLRQGSEHTTGGQAVNLVLRRGRSIAAYVLGQREPRHDAFVIDEYGFIDDAGAELLLALLRCAAGDLQRITGWLPPQVARERLPRGSVRKRKGAIFMAAPLSANGKRYVGQAAQTSPGDTAWPTDHI